MLACENLTIEFGRKPVLKNVSLDFPERKISAIIGPSGCGKSTLLRAFNRMHDLTKGARVTGSVTLNGREIYHTQEDPVLIRRRIGMVFQKANPFPTQSHLRERHRRPAPGRGAQHGPPSRMLPRGPWWDAALWDEVKDRLKSSPMTLSGGQQQRLCIARSLAVDPEVLLMDEPCSALDPIATSKIEELMFRLRERLTVVIVTHNMQQAARASDRTAFLWMGELIEAGETEMIFTNPKKSMTEDYITGRFG